ncbi:MAG: hypothetical protein R3B38_02715 [Patescibacteria group bacterium]
MTNAQRPATISVVMECQLRGKLIPACKEAYRRLRFGMSYSSGTIVCDSFEAIVSNNLDSSQIKVELRKKKKGNLYSKEFLINDADFNFNNPDDEQIYFKVFPPRVEHRLALVMAQPTRPTTFPVQGANSHA